MKVIWEMGSATVKEVCNTISLQKKTAYTTILTLMGILEDKGVLVHTRSGRAYIYRPLLSRERATRNQIRDVICRFFDGRPERLIEMVQELEPLDGDQIYLLAGQVKSREKHQVA